MAGRRAWLIGASAAVLATVALVAWLLVRDTPYVAPAPTGGAAVADPAGAARVLGELEDAVAARDPATASALGPVSDASAGELLADVVGNADALRVEEFTLRYVDAVGAVDESGGWQAAVDMTWRFAGFDRAVVHEEVLVGFQVAQGGAVDGTVAITGFGGGDRRSPLWLSGPLEVRRTAAALILAAGSAQEADLVAERADRAVPVVRGVLPQWSGKLVVEVPASEEGLDAALAAEPGTYTDIAAVSTSVDGTLMPGSQVHVFVNPTVYGGLDPIGGQVVMSHEATHVATGAPLTSGVPLWLLEGFADYVALRDVELPIETTAGQIIAQVRRDGPPDRLPGQAEFDATSTHLGAAYESAWVACLVLADAGGQDALVELYRRVSRTGDLPGPLRKLFGLTEQELTERWRDRLRDLAATAVSGT
jgi:hypothetical protein